jgi:hypothetical protein
MRRLICPPALGLALLACAGRADAAPHVEADPDRDYPIAADVGEWMILAGTFTGDAGPDLAKQLAYQIRKNHNLPAFVFTYADPDRERKHDLLRQAQVPSPTNPGMVLAAHIERSYCVLVGGYKDVDAAHAALTAFKKLPGPELKAPAGVLPFPVVTASKNAADGKTPEEVFKINPFAIAYVVRNPTTPRPDKKIEAQNDPFLLKLNEGEEFSLLKNDKPYTLAIKESLCRRTVKLQKGETSGFLESIGFGGSKGESLGAAAEDAHELAGALRRLHYDAYVLHTRTSSVVAIGGFESENDPGIAKAREDVRKFHQLVLSKLSPAQSDPLNLLRDPVLIPIPRPK